MQSRIKEQEDNIFSQNSTPPVVVVVSQPQFEPFTRPKTQHEKAISLFQQFTETLQAFKNKKQSERPNEQKKATQIIMQNINHFSVGSIRYEVDPIDNSKLQKQYVPMFPHLYKPDGFSREIIEDVIFQFKVNKDKSKTIEGDKVVYNNIQILFKTKNSQNTYYEKYSLDIMFDNVQKFACYEIDNETSRIFIVLRRPCLVLKNFPTNNSKKPYSFQEINSPFSFQSKEKQMFMNYWNLKQVIMLEGTLDFQKNYQDLLTDLQNLDMIPNIDFRYGYDNEVERETQLAQCSIQVLNDEEIQKTHTDLMDRNEAFYSLLNQFIIPLRLSFLTLLSQKKCSVYNDELIDFMKELMQKEVQTESQKPILQASQSPMEFDFYIQDGNDSAQFQVRRVVYLIDKLVGDINVRGRPKYNSKKRRSRTLLEAYRYLEKNSGEITLEIQNETENDNDLRQRRIYQTPTLTLFFANQREQTNRVIRQFKKYKDNFFRLVLVNDQLQKFHFGSMKQKEMLQHMKDLMKQELYIGDSLAQVLNYSNSQLKNHSVWMVCSTSIPEIQPNAIISRLGTFTNEGGNLKMFARRGQCFSTTKYVTKLDPDSNVEVIEDIERPKKNDPDLAQAEPDQREGNYVFTDGCGGVKGVLMLKPDLDGRKVQLRKSQIKFACENWGLEVIRCSTFSQGYLNRQVILLLSCLGVDDNVFLSHLHTALENLNVEKVIKNLYSRSTVFMTSKSKNRKDENENKSKANEMKNELDVFFGPSKIFSPIFKHCLAQTLKQIEQVKKGLPEEMRTKDLHLSPKQVFFLENEPIFDSILSNMVLGLAVNLKKKARIRIKNSCTLIGVIDETGTLDEGEIYLKINRGSYDYDQIQEKLVDEYDEIENADGKKSRLAEINTWLDQIIEGDVIVTKNPCSHPGDIRKLRAVGEHSTFEHLTNVIVFSSKGCRPEQHKMSGGDLDGDVYLCMWDESLVNALQKIEKPAVYKKFEESIKTDSQKDTIVDYMAEYFEKDNLGHLAHLHLGLSDQLGVEGPYNKECVELSWYISIAVDFAKHGKHVDKDKYEMIEKKLDRWPDYMEKNDIGRKTVESPLILGQLYRAVDCKKYLKGSMNVDHKRSICLNYRLSPIIIRPYSYTKFSNRRFHKYLVLAYTEIVAPLNEKLRELMIQYNIGNEGELYCTNLTFCLSDDKLQEGIIGDAGMQKDEDAVNALNNKIKEFIKIFRDKFDYLLQNNECTKFELSQAIYFTTYYNVSNEDTAVYSQNFFFNGSAEEIEGMKEFVEHWQEYQDRTMPEQYEEIIQRLQDFNYYKKYMKKGLISSQEKLKKLLQIKQFFSVPWLVCYENLLSQGGMEDEDQNERSAFE
eukprot:403374620